MAASGTKVPLCPVPGLAPPAVGQRRLLAQSGACTSMWAARNALPSGRVRLHEERPGECRGAAGGVQMRELDARPRRPADDYDGCTGSGTKDRWRRRACRSAVTERPAAAGSAVAAAERDVLLATKLHVPRPRPGFVPRPRLADRLDEGLGRGLVLVCAPAGYGKTVLLADWARHGGEPAAWLSLDAGDNDPARFWRHAVAALDGPCPGSASGSGPLLGPPTAAIIRAAGDGADQRAGRPAGRRTRCCWCSMTIT